LVAADWLFKRRDWRLLKLDIPGWLRPIRLQRWVKRIDMPLDQQLAVDVGDESLDRLGCHRVKLAFLEELVDGRCNFLLDVFRTHENIGLYARFDARQLRHDLLTKLFRVPEPIGKVALE